MESQKKNTLINRPANIPKVFSLQQSFSNLNGKTNSISKRIISDGNTGKMYTNNNGVKSVSDLDHQQLKQSFNFPKVSFDLNKMLSGTSSPSLKDLSLPFPSTNFQRLPNRKRINWNTLLLVLIFISLIYIIIRIK